MANGRGFSMKRLFAAALAAAGVAVPLWLGRVAANSAGQQKAAGTPRGDSMANDATKQLVDRRWKEYFPKGNVEMGDSDAAHLDAI